MCIKKKISNDEAIRKMKMGGSKGIFKADMTELASRRAAQASSSSQSPVETPTAQRCLLRRSGDLGIQYRKERAKRQWNSQEGPTHTLFLR